MYEVKPQDWTLLQVNRKVSGWQLHTDETVKGIPYVVTKVYGPEDWSRGPRYMHYTRADLVRG